MHSVDSTCLATWSDQLELGEYHAIGDDGDDADYGDGDDADADDGDDDHDDDADDDDTDQNQRMIRFYLLAFFLLNLLWYWGAHLRITY